MRLLVLYSFGLVWVNLVTSYQYHNETKPASHELAEFRQRQQRPFERRVFTKIIGEPIDIRQTCSLNTDIFRNRNLFRVLSHVNRERIPERVVHSKGGGAFGYFEVTHDVSDYTLADVYNGIGKRTPCVARFSTNRQKLGGNDVTRDARAIALKMYTKEGNLDYLTFHVPVFFYKDPITFSMNGHVFRRNPRTTLFNQLMRWDMLTIRPEILHTNLFLMADLGIPDGYRYSNYFPLHTYEIYNKHGERFYAKFSFRAELGLRNITNAQARVLSAEDRDYFNRDLYDAIAAKKYPAWLLEMDILSENDVTKVDFDPFDMTRLWKRGTYKTVPIGRLVLNRRVDNNFKDIEKSAFSPDHLVPGISGPIDHVFRSRSLFYPDTQNYRLGVNHAKTPINSPRYQATYSRDGRAPVLENMRDSPNYYPNTFNGPMPYVEERQPEDQAIVFHSNAIDLQPMAEFYNEILENDAHRQRVAENLAVSIKPVSNKTVRDRALRILSLIDVDLGRRVKLALQKLKETPAQETLDKITQCFAHSGHH